MSAARRTPPIVDNVGDMLEGFRTLQTLADSPAHVIPGPDPLALERYPVAVAGIVARVDVALR